MELLAVNPKKARSCILVAQRSLIMWKAGSPWCEAVSDLGVHVDQDIASQHMDNAASKAVALNSLYSGRAHQEC